MRLSPTTAATTLDATARRKPVAMRGTAAGNTTRAKAFQRPAPKESTTSRAPGGVESSPLRVCTNTGKNTITAARARTVAGP